MSLFPSAKELGRRGYAALERDRPKSALRIARRLAKMRYTARFEIAARAYWAMGKDEEALTELREGIRTAPQIYVFYSYLGHYLSDLGRYEEALEVLYRGKTLTSAPTGELEFQVAVVKQRMGDYEGALEAVEGVSLQDSFVPQTAIRFGRAYWFVMSDRPRDALLEVEAGLNLPSIDEDLKSKGGLFAIRGMAYRSLGREVDKVLTEALRALEVCRGQYDALRLIREIEGHRDPAARFGTVLVDGEWSEKFNGRDMRFHAKYSVVAVDDADALRYIKQVEPEKVRDSLQIVIVRWRGSAEGELKGVHQVLGGYVFYPLKRRKTIVKVKL